jgi:hypothetical protein
MFDVHSDLGVTAGEPFAAAYQRLLAALESAWPDDAQAVASAYQGYTGACEQALADPRVQQQVTAALSELTSVLGQARARPEARALVDEAARSYIDEVGAAWSELRADEAGVEALLALATGMTTLAWLFGLGSNTQVAPFGLAGGLDAAGGPFDAFAEPPEPDHSGAAATPEAGDDIVWQEFDVGEDGEIIRRTANSSPPVSPPPPANHGPAGGGARTETGRSRPAARSGPTGPGGPTGARSREAPEVDPLERVRRAYAEYADGIQALGGLGIPLGTTTGREAAPAADVNQRTNELLGSYLRLLYGSGTWPDVYSGYARLLESTTELLQRQNSLARSYEHLLQVALRRHEQLRSAADQRYQRLVGTLRDAWSQIDPATLSPKQLAELADLTGRTAAFGEAASQTDWSRPPR